ncbi:MAG: hypothetical protein NWE88_11995 [Candidatus Bathyarchaeota archaeon]|nr:hypothetical protein [Candidatus Bathyarchaeota archaeon]
MATEYPEVFIRELEMVQSIVDRMANNSFMIKGWTVTLVVVSLLINSQSIHKIIAFLPWLVFWILDAYFIHLEKCYRALHEWLIVTRPDSNECLFNLKAEKRFGDEVDGIITVMFSKTLVPFYGVIFVLILVVNLAL